MMKNRNSPAERKSKKQESRLDQFLELFDIDASRRIQRIGANIGMNGGLMMVISVFFPWMLIDYSTFKPSYEILSRMAALEYFYIGGAVLGVGVISHYFRTYAVKKLSLLLQLAVFGFPLYTSYLIFSFYIPVYNYIPGAVQAGAGILFYVLGTAAVFIGGFMIYFFRDRANEKKIHEKYRVRSGGKKAFERAEELKKDSG